MTLKTSPELIGKEFMHYSRNKKHKIVDIHITRSHITGAVVSEMYVVEFISASGNLTRGEMPRSSITRSVLKNGWIK